jgi:hypothetical protein
MGAHHPEVRSRTKSVRCMPTPTSGRVAPPDIDRSPCGGRYSGLTRSRGVARSPPERPPTGTRRRALVTWSLAASVAPSSNAMRPAATVHLCEALRPISSATAVT